MTVAHIAFQYGQTNTGGAALSATRLHLALLARGIDSHYICVYDRDGEKGANVHVLPRGIWRKIYLVLTKATRCIWRFTAFRRSICTHSIPLFGLEKELKRIKPDIVHVQWINSDVCSFEQLARLPYRLVFNLHDLYMLLGFGVHPGDDPRFEEGFTAANSSWLERWVFNRKRWLVARKRPTFIADSEWVESICRRSLIGRGCPVHTVYNLADPLFTSPVRSFASGSRAPHSQFRLLFGCFGGLTNRFKGFPDLLKAFEYLTPEERARIELQVFGARELAAAEAEKCHRLGVKIVSVGVPSNEDLVQIYCAADLFVFPSVKETIGMTKIEAMLCGLPVVAFDRTACASCVIPVNVPMSSLAHPSRFSHLPDSTDLSRCLPTGWIAPDGDCRSYADGIRYYMAHPVDRAAVAAQLLLQFNADALVNEVLRIYNEDRT